MNREVHVRIWERPEVRVLRATRHDDQFPPTSLSVGYRIGQRTFAAPSPHRLQSAVSGRREPVTPRDST
jgi:hypothetical protein